MTCEALQHNVAKSMRILVIGGGGREHALIWKLSRSSSVSKIWCVPGNGGISRQAECLEVDTADMPGLATLAANLGADLTVVGPEQPLVDGIANEFQSRKLRILAPSRECARLEGSKIFAKEFLNRHRIPTAEAYGIFDSFRGAIDTLDGLPYPLVLKADGLCAGKGVLVAKSAAEAAGFADRVLERREFGEGGKRVLIEEALEGQELSYIILVDGNGHFAVLVPTRDHKRAFDGDQGPNTGGMGAYSSEDIVSPLTEEKIIGEVVRPTLRGLEADGLDYRGFLYFGLMLTPAGPKVLEFNCRLGDPETQAIMARVDFDLAEILAAAAEGKLDAGRLRWKPGASLCVVMASGGYPGKYSVGNEIDGLEEVEKRGCVAIFHAGTRCEKDIYYTSSGRVLGVTAVGGTLEAARRAAYGAVDLIQFSGRQYRTDIGLVGLTASRTANVGDR